MSAAGALFDLLRATSAVTALVSDRIYPVVVPDKKPLPAVAYRRSNTDYVQTLGAVPAAADVAFDIICGAKSPAQAEQIADAVETMQGVTFLNRVDDFDPETEIFANIVTVQLLTQ